MIKEELLKPRYKLIVDYPSNILEVGTIVNASTNELIAFYNKYPNIFQLLPWYAERKVEDIALVEQIWKDIKGYEGYYQVSELGFIKSLDRNIKRKFKGVKEYGVDKKGGLLKLQKRKDGYLKVELSKNDKTKVMYVHRIVADTFVEYDDSRKYINHLDSDRSNNLYSNLQRCTQSENLIHAVKTNDYCGKIRSNPKRYPNLIH